MYNQLIKERFINEEVANSNVPKFKNIFKISKMHESLLEKDLYDFNLDELQKLFHDFGIKTPHQINEKFRLVRDYINHSISYGLRKNNINPLMELSPEWKNQFLEIEN
jgi:hypothetical protein